MEHVFASFTEKRLQAAESSGTALMKWPDIWLTQCSNQIPFATKKLMTYPT